MFTISPICHLTTCFTGSLNPSLPEPSMCHLHVTPSFHEPSLLPISSHNSTSSPVRTSPLLPMSQYIVLMSTQKTNSRANVMSEYHICCLCSINTPSHAHAQSVHHLSYQYPVSTPHLLTMSSQYNTSSAHVHSIHHLDRPFRPVSLNKVSST